ncbi:MAG: hypothetical protein Q8O67_11005 [Deltaproteobacteria bacterium]|nr:hypothetical protein [Deltaproteobacteria bacterium]
MSASATVTRTALVEAIVELQRLLGRKKNTGSAVWKLEAGVGLSIIWGNFEQSVDADVTTPGTFEVPAVVMRTLPTSLPASDPLTVSGEGRRFQVGSFVVDGSAAPRQRSTSVPPEPSDLDILVSMGGLTVAERRTLGTEARYTDMQQRLGAAVKAAAELLGPFGIHELELLRFVLDQARTRADR